MVNNGESMDHINIPYGFVWKWLVPLNPMVLLIIIPFLNGYFIGVYPIFRQTQIFDPYPELSTFVIS